MKIQWLGHASFKVTGSKRVSVIMDPFDEKVGYPMPNETAEIVTVSHGHADHSTVRAVSGSPQVVDQAGEYYINGVAIRGVESFHDNAQGTQRGKNIIFTVEMDGIKVCHLGDLGHGLREDTLLAIGRIDVLLLPIGGFYTIDYTAAAIVMAELQPYLTIPMHYKTQYTPQFPIDDEKPFLELIKGGTYLDGNIIEFTRRQWQDGEGVNGVVVMKLP